jgi:uncharacterized delta-60 repeat protein
MSRQRTHPGCPVETLESRTLFNGGALDPTFGTNGQSTVFGFEETAVAAQPDGKTVVVGALNNHFITGRLNPDGSIDHAFGPNKSGTVETSFGGIRSEADEVVVQPDGKILVAGVRQDTIEDEPLESWVLARYNPDGSLDTSYGTGGTEHVLGSQNTGGITSLALQPDGKILFTATRFDGYFSGGYNFAVVRLRPDGSLDPTFGDAADSGRKGYVTTDFGDHDGAFTVAVQPDGKIVAGGIRLTSEGTDVTWVLARYTADGRLDTTFDGDGSTSTPLINAGRLDAVAVDTDGRIYAAGSVDNHVFVGRFNADGSFDTSFGNGGVFTKFGTADEQNEAFSLILPQPGKVLVVGAENAFADSHHVVAAEYLDNGSLDPSFGTGGVATFDTGAPVERTVANLTADGKVVVAANGPVSGSLSSVRRFSATPPPVVTLSAGGNGAAAEGGAGGSVVFSRDAAYNFNTRVHYQLSGSATPISDYTGRLAPTLPTKFGPVLNSLLEYIDIPAGQSSVTIPLTVVDDGVLENVETATVTGKANPAYTFAQQIIPTQKGPISISLSTASVTIYDNDGVKVNFRPANTAVPAGYVADTGSVFADRANGFSYGWDADNSVNARVRNDPLSPNAAYDSFNHTQKNGADRRWELAVPNGLYVVTLAAGDADATDSVYKFNLEGSLALSGTPGGLTHWYRSTTIVQVTDGRLTLTNAAGAQNNKINFVEVQAAGLGAVPGPVTGSQPILLKFPSATDLTPPLGTGTSTGSGTLG